MNSILLDLGFIKIYWYSVFIFLGFLAGGTMVLRETRKFKIPDDFTTNLFFYVFVFGMIGARLYYVAFNFDYYSTNLLDIFKIWEGGLAIHGGLIFGIMVILFQCKRNKLPFLKILDMVVVGLIIGQAIGRWGNFTNGEAFGPITTLEKLTSIHLPKFIIDGMYIHGNYHVPTFLYESIWCFIGFIVLLIIRRLRYTKNGNVFASYLIWYGLGRCYIEHLRTDSLMLGNFKMAQIVSILMIVIGIIIIVKNLKYSAFDNNYKDSLDTSKMHY